MRKLYIHVLLLFALVASADSFASERRKKSCTTRALCILAGIFGVMASGQVEAVAATNAVMGDSASVESDLLARLPRLSRLKVVCNTPEDEERKERKRYCSYVANCLKHNNIEDELARLKAQDNNPAVYFESRHFDHRVIDLCRLDKCDSMPFASHEWFGYTRELVDFVESDNE